MMVILWADKVPLAMASGPIPCLATSFCVTSLTPPHSPQVKLDSRMITNSNRRSTRDRVTLFVVPFMDAKFTRQTHSCLSGVLHPTGQPPKFHQRSPTLLGMEPPGCLPISFSDTPTRSIQLLTGYDNLLRR
jgi:hypothetical protein